MERAIQLQCAYRQMRTKIAMIRVAMLTPCESHLEVRMNDKVKERIANGCMERQL